MKHKKRHDSSGAEGGVGRGVSLTVVGKGWGILPQEKQKYVMQFNTQDWNRTGYLSGKWVSIPGAILELEFGNETSGLIMNLVIVIV